MWDSVTGKSLGTVGRHRNVVVACCFSPDGKMIASISSEGALKLWDAITSARIAKFKGRPWARHCAFSPEGAVVVAVFGDEVIRLWKVPNAAELATLKSRLRTWLGIGAASFKRPTVSLDGHRLHVSAVKFSEDGKQFLSASNDRTLRLWGLPNGTRLATFMGHTSDVNDCALSRDGTRAISASSDYSLRVWDTSLNADDLNHLAHSDRVTVCGVSPDCTRIVSASWDNTIKVWDAQGGERVLTIDTLQPVLVCTFSPTSDLIASSSYGGEVKLWNAKTGAECLALTGPASTINACAFSPDGRRLVCAHSGAVYSGYKAAPLMLWDLATGRDVALMSGHREEVKDCAFSPDGTRIVSASSDYTLRVWDGMTGDHLGMEFQGTAPFAFSPDGRRVASSWTSIRIWDAAIGEELGSFGQLTYFPYHLAYSPDGNRIVSISRDEPLKDESLLKLWDAKSGQEITTLRESTIRACAFSPDSSRLVTASWDGKLKVWDANNGSFVCEYWIGGSIDHIVWSADGSRIVAGTYVGGVYVFHPVNLLVGLPIATAWASPSDGSHAFGCAICKSWTEIEPSRLGAVVCCGKCGAERMLNRFTIPGDWLSVAAGWRARTTTLA
jgi:WD40 repeat protein